jgi:hypothetical protein
MSDQSDKFAEHQFLRPRTRGELKKALESKIKCEVVSSNVGITSLFLIGWLKFDKFKTYPSTNDGWTIYESIS